MNAFEHVIVLLSFVYALAIAHLLTTIARLIGSGERVRFSWLHGYWMLNALIVLIADWISYWDIRSVPSWTMVSILVVLLQSFVDYMQAALVCPEIPADGPIDLVEFHRTRSRRYIGAFAVTVTMASITNVYFGNAFNISDYIKQEGVVLVLMAAAVTATIYRHRVVQIVVTFLLAAAWAYYFISLQGALH
jgi:hypothetical protein